VKDNNRYCVKILLRFYFNIPIITKFKLMKASLTRYIQKTTKNNPHIFHI